MTRRSYGIMCGLLLSLMLQLSCSVSKRIEYSNNASLLEDNFFGELHNDKTKTDWILAILGEPLFMDSVDERVATYTWQLSRSSYTHLGLLVVLRYNTVEQEREYFHVVSVQGVIKKHWLDHLPNIRARTIEKYL